MKWQRSDVSDNMYTTQYGPWRFCVWRCRGYSGSWRWTVAMDEDQLFGHLDALQGYKTAAAAKAACTRFAKRFLKGVEG